MACYPGNLGFQEMMQLTFKANDEQLKKLDKIVNNNDQNGFRRLVKEVLGVTLH